MKQKICIFLMGAVMAVSLAGCGQTGGMGTENLSEKEEVLTKQDDTEQPDDQSTAMPEKPEEDAVSDGQPAGAEAENGAGEDSEETVPEFLPGYATFDDWKARHLGSVGLITDRTLLVSIYLNEPDCRWEQEEIEYTRQLMEIGYGYLQEQMEQYGADTDLIYDSRKNADLFYELDIEEAIPAYVTTEKERELDKEVDRWLTNVPVEDLMQKYETDSIGFLFFIAHEGCSYSSMHFVDDGSETWDECCMLYLQDMYSDTLEYETPAVFAHELLHLFGAEDLYKTAEVFSAGTYAYVNENYPNDIMNKTYVKINGQYTTYPDKVVQEISPVTAYMIGVAPDDPVREKCPELLKDETGCFSGSTYDRPF